MATAAEPRPASPPLPGGRADATVRLRPLLCGRFVDAGAPRCTARRAGSRALRALGIGVRATTGRRSRWWPSSSSIPGAGARARGHGLPPLDRGDAARGVRPRRGARDQGRAAWSRSRPCPPSCGELGIQPADVEVVVMTHLHSDHASGIAEFPESTFVVSSAEWEAAGSSGRMQGVLAAPVRPRLRVAHARLRVAGRGLATPPSDARSTCSATAACGWSPHPATPPATCRWCCGCATARCCSPATPPTRAARSRSRCCPTGWRTSTASAARCSEIQLYARENPGALVICGHDFEQWRELRGGVRVGARVDRLLRTRATRRAPRRRLGGPAGRAGGLHHALASLGAQPRVQRAHVLEHDLGRGLRPDRGWARRPARSGPGRRTAR